MCLALPVEIIELLADNRAMISVGGVTREIALDLVEDVKIGDYVILHVGYALAKLNKEEADTTLGLFSEMLEEQK